MLDPVFRQYLQEVLGVAAPQEGSSAVELAQSLSAPEGELRTKILQSIGVTEEAVRDWPEGPCGSLVLKDRHFLSFDSHAPIGRQSLDGLVRWNLPSLKDMLGEGVEVQNRKRQAWHWLQQLKQELSTV
ncbi:MAG: hypothetical protein AB7F86_02010 [Bdellovibrionales bacterium]